MYINIAEPRPYIQVLSVWGGKGGKELLGGKRETPQSKSWVWPACCTYLAVSLYGHHTPKVDGEKANFFLKSNSTKLQKRQPNTCVKNLPIEKKRPWIGSLIWWWNMTPFFDNGDQQTATFLFKHRRKVVHYITSMLSSSTCHKTLFEVLMDSTFSVTLGQQHPMLAKNMPATRKKNPKV